MPDTRRCPACGSGFKTDESPALPAVCPQCGITLTDPPTWPYGAASAQSTSEPCGHTRQSRLRLAVPWLIVLVIVAVFTWIIALSYIRARQGAQMVRCHARLQTIGHALLTYAQEHHNSFPPDLDTLVASGFLAPRELQCPLVEKINDVYIAGQKSTDYPIRVLVYEPAENHDIGSANVLFLDGHVTSVRPAELTQLLAPPTPATAPAQRAH